MLTFGLALAWSAALLLMDLTSGDSEVISRDQIRQADVVVIVRRDAGESDHVKVERVIRGDVAVGDRLQVLNLADVRRWSDDRDYIVALSQSRQDFVVTRLEGQRDPPLVYESSPAAVEEVKAILRDHL